VFRPLSHGTGNPSALAIFACEPVGGLGAMDTVKQTHIVPMPNQNMLDDGLRTSLGELTLPIVCERLTGFFAVAEEKFYWQCNWPMSHSSL